jgi:type IX secretion system PorP/SprF family membrane protein
MKRILALISLVTVGNSFSQQMPQYSQYLRNQFMVNPAAVGVNDFVDVTMGGRWQWMGFGNEPRTAYLSVTSPISITPRPKYNPALRVSQANVRKPEIKTGKFKHALGGQLIADQYGAFRKMEFAGTYAIHMPVSKKFNLSFGTRLGLSNNTFLNDKAQTLNLVDPTLGYTDATYDKFSANQSSKYIMNLGVGLYLYSKNSFFGISTDQLTRDLVKFGTGTANFNNQMHFNATAGVKIPLNENLTLTPAMLIKYMNPAPIAIEGTLQLEYKELLWIGTSYRHKDAIIGMVGLNIRDRFKFGYSYDFSLSRFNNLSQGGHELVLGLMLGR